VAVDAVGVRPPTTCADLDVAPGEVRCFSTVDPVASGVPADVTATTPPPGLSPQDVASIYQLPAVTPGVTPGPDSPTVAIIDAGGTPTLEADLAAYRAQYGMGPCTIASGCLTILDQHGSTTSPPPLIAGWDFETALDADAVAAACPACRLVVVEADSPSSDDLDAATRIAAQHASYVSMSWGSDDEDLSRFSDVASTERIFSHPDVTFVASSGDLGWATRTTLGTYICGRNATYAAGPSRSCAQYPATSPQVIAAGGTVASWSTSAQAWTQSTWYPRTGDLNGGGPSSGCSVVAPMSALQSLNAKATAACGTFRATTDLSALADDFAVYHQDLTQPPSPDPAQNWWVMGGTSLSAPLLAGMYAQAGNHTAPLDIYRRAAADPAAFVDVTGGATRSCDPVRDRLHLCSAGAGWDGPTGLGTPRGLAGLMPYAERDGTSTVTTAKLARLSHRGPVTVRGKARVRRTLRASYGTFAPGSRLTVTWLVDGHPVARGTRLRVKARWRHHRIRYVVTASAAGHASLTLTSRSVRIRR
jgi:hypothetical protein